MKRSVTSRVVTGEFSKRATQSCPYTTITTATTIYDTDKANATWSLRVTMSPAPAAPPNAKAKGPLLPETYLDAPSQRLYYLSLGLLCQVWHFLVTHLPTDPFVFRQSSCLISFTTLPRPTAPSDYARNGSWSTSFIASFCRICAYLGSTIASQSSSCRLHVCGS